MFLLVVVMFLLCLDFLICCFGVLFWCGCGLMREDFRDEVWRGEVLIWWDFFVVDFCRKGIWWDVS